MITAIQKHPDKTIELTLTIPWEDIQKVHDEAVNDFCAGVEIQGFRKGKAPRKLAEEHLDKQKVLEEVIKRVLPKVYSEAIEKERIKPLTMPRIELISAKEKEEWKIKAVTCEKPDITLGNYTEAIRELKNTKRQNIWVPGQEQKKEEKAEDKKPTLDELLNTLFSSITIQLPRVLVEQEVNKMLSDLIDQTKRLGLTVDQYLSSTNKTPESVRQEYEEQAKRMLTLEFCLEEIADKEKIIVTDSDIDAALKTAKTEEDRKSLEKKRYYVASVLRRQKTLDYIAAL